MLNKKSDIEDYMNDNILKKSFYKIKFRYFLLSIPIGFISIYFLMKSLGLNGFLLKYTVVILTYVLSLILCYRITNKNGISFKKLFSFKGKKIKFFEIIGLFILMKIISLSLLLTALLFLKKPITDFQQSPQPIEPIKTLILLAILSVFIAPVMEEVFFRGVLMQAWALRWGLKRGIILSSLLFAAIHFSTQFIDLFLGGIILSTLFIKYRSLVVPILFHTLNNIIAQIPTFFSKVSSSGGNLNLHEARIAGLVGLIFFIVSVSVLVIYFKKNQLRAGLPVG